MLSLYSDVIIRYNFSKTNEIPIMSTQVCDIVSILTILQREHYHNLQYYSLLYLQGPHHASESSLYMYYRSNMDESTRGM